MGKSKTGKIATAFTALGSIFIIIAFTTPNWLVNDGKMENPRFDKLGKLIITVMLSKKKK